MKLYVGNLPYEMNEDELRDMFSQFGEVATVNIITDRVTKRPKGFGFVEMPNNEEAENAMKDLNEKEIKGRKIRVNEARPKEENPRYN
ncbi:RNA-binding protein [candidate division WOR-3 bacterium]|nr:RNA-binding protein [candidate division WOR-3 bacterium]